LLLLLLLLLWSDGCGAQAAKQKSLAEIAAEKAPDHAHTKHEQQAVAELAKQQTTALGKRGYPPCSSRWEFSWFLGLHCF
jgi:hypothetical protein